jgi:hypothetical protein
MRAMTVVVWQADDHSARQPVPAVSNWALLYLRQIFKWVGNEALYDLSRHVSRGLHALPSRWLSPDGGQ